MPKIGDTLPFSRRQFTRSTDSFPGRFVQPLLHVLPLISLCYVAVLLADSLYFHGWPDFLRAIGHDKKLHLIATVATVMVSLPAFVWAFLAGSISYPRYALLWHHVTGALVTLFFALGTLVFPDGGYMIRLLAATVPLHVFVYVFIRYLNLAPWMGLVFLVAGAGLFVFGKTL